MADILIRTNARPTPAGAITELSIHEARQLTGGDLAIEALEIAHEGFSSQHSGGANFVFCDGSVRF